LLENKAKSPFKHNKKLSNAKSQNNLANDNSTNLKYQEQQLKLFIIDLQKQFGIT
jgi:hypothetical protein